MGHRIRDLATRASVQAIVVMAVTVPAMVLRRDGAAFFGMVSSLVFTILVGVGLVFRPRFWPAIGSALFFWLVVFFGSFAVADAVTGGLRDDAMAFLPAFMLVVPVLVAASIIHLVWRRTRKAGVEP